MEQQKNKFSINFVNLTGYITIISVGIISIFDIPSIFQRWLAVVILTCLVIIQIRGINTENISLKNHLYLGVQTVLVILLFLFSPESLFISFIFFVLSVNAMLSFKLRIPVLWIVLFTLISGSFAIYHLGWWEGMRQVFPLICGYFFFGVFANSLYNAIVAQKHVESLLEQLRSTHIQLQEYAQRVEALAIAEERNHLAREMHDTIGHHLTVAAVQLEGAQRLIHENPQRAEAMVATVRQQIKEALSETRQTVSHLRLPLKMELPLIQSLPALIAEFAEVSRIKIHLQMCETLPELEEAQRLALYRAAQEALTNVQRHSQAQQVWVDLTYDDENITLCIQDDGCGLPEHLESQGFGLLGLRERAALLGGSTEIRNRESNGVSILFSLPIHN